MDRRRFLQMAGGAVGVAAVPRTLRPASATTPGSFVHGVASGDPLADAVVIWTRLTPAGETVAEQGTAQTRPNEVVDWEVATDPAFANVVRSGSYTTGSFRDFTVKVDVDGLTPGTGYWYRFHHGSITSPAGQARTAPSGTLGHLRFGFVSCSNFEGGYFSPYRFLAQRDDLDFVLHLGDYYYEYASGGYGPGPAIGRVHRPAHEIVSLADYRQRHASYREDPDLQELHRKFPFILTWDDHEVTNNSWSHGAENHQPDEGDYLVRKAAAYQAYFEWLPVRDHQPDPGELKRLYRGFAFGDLVDLSMLDLRQYRSEQIQGFYGDAVSFDPEGYSGDRTITGRAQMDWIKARLAGATATWKLVGNSVMITPIHFPPLPKDVGAAASELFGVAAPHEGIAGNIDQWDGYAADRNELLGHIAGQGIDNVTFLVGDVHSTFACDVPLDSALYPTMSPSIATELVSTSVTSDNFNEITRTPPRTTTRVLEEYFKANNRHIKHYEFDSHGCSIVDVTPERLQVDWYYTADRTKRDSEVTHAVSWKVEAGANAVQRAAGPAT